MGKRHGQIIQRFADGRTVVTNWEHGIKQGKEPESITIIFDVKQQEMDIIEQFSISYNSSYLSVQLTPKIGKKFLRVQSCGSGKQRKVSFNLDNSIHKWDIKSR